MTAAELTELKGQKQKKLIIISKGILAAQCLTGIYGKETNAVLISTIKIIQTKINCTMVDRNCRK